MEFTTKKAIIAAAIEYMNTHALSQSDMANKANIRKEYINIMFKEDSDFMYSAGKTKGLIHVRYFNALAELIGYKVNLEFWTTQPTPQANSILANLKDAKENHLTITLIGETGSGKSFMSKLFAQKNPADTYIVTAGSSDTLNDLIDKILDATKTHSPGSSKSAKLRELSRFFKMQRNYGKTPMLVIDESEYLKVAALCAMKELYDNVHEYAAIVFIGTDQFVMNMEKLKRRNKSGIPQFHRRIKFGLRYLPSIDRSFKIFVDDIEDKELVKFILRNCSNYGELHDLLEPAMREAHRLNVPLTMALVRKVLNLPDGDMLW
jgi:DNA transposition AAA+ family ATPase